MGGQGRSWRHPCIAGKKGRAEVLQRGRLLGDRCACGVECHRISGIVNNNIYYDVIYYTSLSYIMFLESQLNRNVLFLYSKMITENHTYRSIFVKNSLKKSQKSFSIVTSTMSSAFIIFSNSVACFMILTFIVITFSVHKVVGLCRGFAKNIVNDVGIVIQGEHEGELPEKLLAVGALNRINVNIRQKLD